MRKTEKPRQRAGNGGLTWLIRPYSRRVRHPDRGSTTATWSASRRWTHAGEIGWNGVTFSPINIALAPTQALEAASLSCTRLEARSTLHPGYAQRGNGPGRR
jgi:hypothetical protein